MIPCERDSFLDVIWRPSIDTDYRHIPLPTGEPERGVEVAALDGPVGKGVCLEVGVLGGTGLIRTPDTVVPTTKDIGAISGGRVVARRGRWYRMDERLRDFVGESLKFRLRRPTVRSECTAAALGLPRRCRRKTEREGQESEEVHGFVACLGCIVLLRT